MGDVLPVPEDLTLSGRHQTHDDLGQRGFAAAVGTGKDHQLVIVHGQGNVLQDAQSLIGFPNGIADMF